MEKYYYQRGQKIPVYEVEGVMAVQVDSVTRDNAGAQAFGQLIEAERGTAFTADAPTEELEALKSANWVFVQPTRDFSASVRSRDDGPSGVQAVGQVYQKEDGHILIGSSNLIVQLSPELSDKAARRELKKRNLKIIRALAFARNQFQVEVDPAENVLKVANDLQESNVAVAAEPEFIEFIGQRLRPTDPTYGQQWHLNNPGGNGGVVGADIAAERAWDFTRGQGVRVAVIDNGFDVTHQDLRAGIVNESGFFNRAGAFRQTLTSFPDSNHGTFCAGMVGARQNNGRDGSGSAPECQLMLLATIGDQVGTQATLARAVAYAANPRLEITGASANSGADVIVSSLGPNGANWALTSVLQNAILYATRQGRRGRGTPIFWASSNGRNVDISLDQVVSHPNVIAVGRSARNDREDNSARGPELDFLAPGVNVVSTASGGGTRTDTGTSFAAPLAAGIGALVLGINPNLTAQKVRKILRDTCDKIGGANYSPSGHNDDYGYGRLNAFKAVIRGLQSISINGNLNTDHDGDRLAEIPVTSPWGIGTLKVRSGSISHIAMAPNGRRFNGWLLNTADNRFPQKGNFIGSRKSELLVTSPWGLGVLQRFRSTYRALMLARNGTRFGGWLLNTNDNEFGPVGDFDGDRREEILVRSPWGIGVLKLTAGPSRTYNFQPLMMAANGTRFGDWLLNTTDNLLGPVGDFDGDGRDEIIISSPWGLGMLKLSGDSFDVVTMAPNGTRFGGWLLNTFDNRLWAAADLNGNGRDELLITSPWGIGVLSLSSRGLNSLMLAPNGTRFGGWLLNTADNQFRNFQDMTGAGRSSILVESPWGIGIMTLRGSRFQVPVMVPNGTRLGNWLLNTHDNKF